LARAAVVKQVSRLAPVCPYEERRARRLGLCAVGPSIRRAARATFCPQGALCLLDPGCRCLSAVCLLLVVLICLPAHPAYTS
jgi:hypothetical protein